jgi:hypothetical protein
MMGKPNLIWSLIQLRLANQHKIVLIGRMKGVKVNIYGVCNISNFELIKMVDGRKPYPFFLGLDWEFYNQTIIGLKKRQMIFEVVELKVTAPLDPMEGRRYVEPTKGK